MKTVFLMLAFSWLAVRFAPAVVEGKISDAEWYETSNKILVLEYENPLGGREGVQLSQLIGRMALSTTTGVEQFAVVTLRQEDKRMELTEANVTAVAKRQRAPVVIWGEFYQQKGRVFVTSHLRYAPNLSPRNFGRNKDPNVSKFSWDISKLNIPERTQAFASLPSAQINFAPIEITTPNLSALQEAWRKTLTIREQPDEASPERGELPLDTPYSIQSGENGWSYVSTPQLSGWVRLGDLSRLDDFNELTGVVLYAQGLMQHVTNHHPAAVETFTRYLEKYAPKQDTMNKAMAHVLAGYSGMRASSDWDLSLKHFEAAKALIPNASAPVNCIALAVFAKAALSGANEGQTLALEKDLIRAVQTESDVDAIRNLEILYRMPQAEAFFKKKSPNFLQARDTQLNVLRKLEQRVQRDPGG